MTSIQDDWVLVMYPEDEDLHLSPTTSTKDSLDPGLPLPHPTKSSWLIPPDPLHNHRSSKSLPVDVLDVVIIGSGFSGTSVAWHLLHDQPSTPNLKILMLEARDVCSGATGRNGSSSVLTGVDCRWSLIM
jgi:hypothetical protein